ncbi:MAG: PAS domain S-box protein [Promethearchaeota archaeon]|nr:MAG: PAS domain S-box protein [Candidatus Lokiarchaeota archaeon]
MDIKIKRKYCYIVESVFFIYTIVIGLSFTLSYDSIFDYFLTICAFLGFTSLFFTTLTGQSSNIYKLNRNESIKISLAFSITSMCFIIVHVVLILSKLLSEQFFSLNFILIDSIPVFFGFGAFFLVLFVNLGKLFKNHLNLKTWKILYPLNYLALITIYIHGILFNIFFSNISILILFTSLLIISFQTIIYGNYKIERRIENKNKLQNIISRFSSSFLLKKNIDDDINNFLHDIGKISGADRSYLFLFDKENRSMTNTHEWTQKYITPQIQNLQDLPFEEFPWWMKKLNNRECIHIKNVSKLPLEASAEKKILEAQDIKSLLVFPILIMNEVSGFLGLDNIQYTDVWDTDDFKLLRTSSELIGHVLERKLILDQLDSSKEKYEIITENANDLIIILNEKYQLEYINEKTNKKLLGTNGKEVLGSNPIKYVHPNDKKKVLKALEEGNRKGEGTIEARIRNNMGQYLWFELKGKKIFDKRDRESKGIIVAREISERKKAEKELRESEEKYRQLIKNSPSFIVLLNSEGKIVDCNRATEKITGYNKEELIGEKFEDLSIIHTKHIPIISKRFNLVREGQKLAPIDIQIYMKDSTPIWLKYSSSIVKIAGKNFILIMGYEITKQKQAELLIEEELEKLKELDQLRKDLISRVSHELKTPLVSIRGVTELIMQIYQDKLDKNDVELFKILERGEKRLEKLIENLIDISRIEYNEFKLEKQTTDLCHLIRDCSTMMNHLILEKRLSINLTLPDSLILHIDPMKIEQVILNLLLNAIKHTPPEGEITITVKENNSHIEISIHDTGIGITKKEKERLFTQFGKIERYEEGLEEINIQGAGLGLYICKNITEMHGGKIWVESEGRNKGSTFTFSLPK